jgi:PAS domain S-box-containing protein
VTSPRGFTRWLVARSQALGLSILFVITASSILWFLAFFIPGERQDAIDGWRRDLSLIADTRRDLLDRRISDGLANASFVATFPSVRALVSSAPHESSGEGSVLHINAILSDFRNVYGERSISICDTVGVAVASSDGPGPGADALALAREAAHTGKARVDLVREPDGVTGFTLAVPVRAEAGASESPGGEARGAVLIVADAREALFDLLRQPFTSAAGTGEILLVRKEGDAALHLSPLLFRPDPPLTFRHRLRAPGATAREAFEGDDVFGSFVDYRGVNVFSARRKLARAPWSLVVKVDEDEALAAFRKDVLRRGLMWGGLLLALIAVVFGLWRSLVAAHEVALARSEARFGALVEQATDAIFLVGSDGRVLRANRAAEVTYGWTRDELLSMHAADVRASATRDALRHDMETAAARGSLLVETRHRRADGGEFPVEVNMGLVKAEDETLFLSIVRDITERKVAEEALRQSNVELRKLARVVEQTPATVMLTDLEGRIEYVNPRFTEVTGYTAEEALGQNPRILKSDRTPPEVHRAMWETLTAGRVWQGELCNKKKDGALFWEQASISPVRDEHGNTTSYVAVKEDVTLQKRAAEELERTQQQLLQAQKMEAVGRLAGGVAHDFNNLLTVIQGYGELVRDSLSGDPRRESMSELLKAATRATSLTNQLLAFSRKQHLEPKVVSLGTVVRETGRMLERLIGEDIALSLVTPEELANVKADPSQIEQVVLNLAVNARDAMPNGGHLTVSVGSLTMATPLDGFPDQLPAGRWVLMTVEDTGCGMDAETLSHAFEPFFTTKERGKGTGLGLSTVYGIVRQSDGRIQVMSVPGRGTSFQIYLPRSDERTTSGTHPSVGSNRGTETVLVVEDEAAVRNLVRTVLGRKGYAVLAAQDGAAALDLLEKHTGVIHVLLTDVVMPGMNGRDLAARVRAHRPTIKVVFMSGYTADVPTELGTEDGTAFLSKPFNERALAAKLREVLDTPPA